MGGPALTERFKLDTELQMAKLLTLNRRCAMEGWFQPFQLSLPRFAEVRDRPDLLSVRSISTEVWEAAVLDFASTPEGDGHSTRGSSRGEDDIVARIQASPLQALGDNRDMADASLRNRIGGGGFRAPGDLRTFGCVSYI